MKDDALLPEKCAPRYHRYPEYFARLASPDIADKLLQDIRAAAERLRDHFFGATPQRHCWRPAFSFGAFALIIVTDGNVEIARILHERRDMAAVFAKD